MHSRLFSFLPVLASIRSDSLGDNDGDKLLSDLDVNPRVRAKLHILVPELSGGLGESGVVDVDGEVFAGGDADVTNARQVDLGLVGLLADLDIRGRAGGFAATNLVHS